MEKGPDSRMDAPPRIAPRQVFGDPGAGTNATAPNSSSAASTHGSLLDWNPQQACSLPHPGHDTQRLRTCVQPLPLRPIALESALTAQQRRGQYAGSAHQQLLRTLPGYQLSPGRSPCTPTTNDSRYALSYSPSLSSVLSGRPGCAGNDVFSRSRANGHSAQAGGLLTGHSRNGVMGQKSASLGPAAAAAALGEVACGQTHSLPGPRKFSPNIDASKNGGCSIKEDRDHPLIADVKEESSNARRSCFGIEEGLLTRTLLSSSQKNSNGPTKAGNDTSAKDCSGVSAGIENGRRPSGHAIRAGHSGAELPSHLRASARIMESNVRLLHQQLRSSKEGRVKKEKKSKDLLELSWVGGDVRDENGTSGLYTPLTLPFIVKEEVEDEEDEHKEERNPDAAPVKTMRPRRTRRPTARHVEEANRFAAGLLLAEDGASKDPSRANSDTWDLADDEGSKGVEFLHICFPFAFPPLDRQAMIEAEELRDQQVRRSDSGSTTDSGDGRTCSGSSSCSGTGASSQGKRNLTNFPLQPSPPLRLPELPEGRIGRLLVHRSGRVKLRLLSNESEGNEGPECATQPLPKKVNPSKTPTSDTMSGDASDEVSASTQKSPAEVSGNAGINAGKKDRLRRGGNDKGISFEVNVGSECTFAQDVGCFFRESSEFLFLGRCNKRLVVAPDIKSWLANGQRTPAAAAAAS